MERRLTDTRLTGIEHELEDIHAFMNETLRRLESLEDWRRELMTHVPEYNAQSSEYSTNEHYTTDAPAFMQKTLERLGALEDWRRGIKIRNASAGHTQSLMSGFSTNVRNRVEPRFNKNALSIMKGDPALSYLRAKNKANSLRSGKTMKRRSQRGLKPIQEVPEENT